MNVQNRRSLPSLTGLTISITFEKNCEKPTGYEIESKCFDEEEDSQFSDLTDRTGMEEEFDKLRTEQDEESVQFSVATDSQSHLPSVSCYGESQRTAYLSRRLTMTKSRTAKTHEAWQGLLDQWQNLAASSSTPAGAASRKRASRNLGLPPGALPRNRKTSSRLLPTRPRVARVSNSTTDRGEVWNDLVGQWSDLRGKK